jgi:DNA-binding MarR family transcriptional regulator
MACVNAKQTAQVMTQKSKRNTKGFNSAGRLRLDLPNFVPYRITTLAALVRREFAKIYRDDPGLNEPEWKVLTALAHFGPLPSGDIGLYVTLDRVAVSRALTRLIDLGLATRSENPADLRMFTVDLTPRAARLYDRMSAQLLEIEERILATLDQDDVRDLLRLLDKVEACFRSPADRRRLMLMRDARENGETRPVAPIRRGKAARASNKT